MNIKPIVQVESADLTITCDKGCKKKVVIVGKDFVRVKVTGLPGIYESGIACPLCGTFYIAAYDSDVLIAQRAELQRSRGPLRKVLQRTYELDFKQLQRDMVEQERRAREDGRPET